MHLKSGDETLERLITIRHKAYLKSKATKFHHHVREWRAANAAYVRQRDHQNAPKGIPQTP